MQCCYKSLIYPFLQVSWIAIKFTIQTICAVLCDAAPNISFIFTSLHLSSWHTKGHTHSRSVCSAVVNIPSSLRHAGAGMQQFCRRFHKESVFVYAMLLSISLFHRHLIYCHGIQKDNTVVVYAVLLLIFHRQAVLSSSQATRARLCIAALNMP